MKEIYMLNKGDSVDKVKYEYGILTNEILNNVKFNFRYVELNKGNDDIIIVKNYLPYFEYIVQKNETIMDILARGFKVENTNSINAGDIIVLNKPKSIRYVTKPLETLDDIAKKFGIEKKYIMQVNNLSIERLFVGQILWL